MPESARELQNPVGGFMRPVDGRHHNPAGLARRFQRQIAYIQHPLTKGLVDANILYFSELHRACGFRKETRFIAQPVVEDRQFDHATSNMAGQEVKRRQRWQGEPCPHSFILVVNRE